MLLTLRTTKEPATDLGFLLHKNPARAQTIDLPFGQAHVFWPEATPSAACCALWVVVDPVALVRGKADAPGDGPLAMYVNDRPYVASSFLSVALARVFGSALNGRSSERPELAQTALPLRITVDVVASRGGPAWLERLFGPLGYTVDAQRLPRDETVPEWGPSALHRMVLTHEIPLMTALRHLYVLLPVLDDHKHYWVGTDEVDKLVAKGEAWLAEHPDREFIVHRYLKHRRGLARRALGQLEDPDAEDGEDLEDLEGTSVPGEPRLERPYKLNDVRLDRVVDVLRSAGVRSVVDLGCGEGKLLRRLLAVNEIDRVIGIDASPRALDVAARRFEGPRVPLSYAKRLQLLVGSAVYRDPRLDGMDAIVLVEVIEHIDAVRLPALEASVFGSARPQMVLVTTPNAEYNVRFETLPAGRFRHADHRFEWTRAQFEAWASGVAERHGYTVTFEPIGPLDEMVGAPTQMGVFRWSS
ncbi:MAG: 3' terminal RNA ribose 2'-O-methyltransferase Hen1 [Myxococcota bacterium]